MADPESPTVEAYVIDGTRLAKSYADCKRKQADLAKFVRGTP